MKARFDLVDKTFYEGFGIWPRYTAIDGQRPFKWGREEFH